jgi:WD40 repeat protein/serine/threonine protein kinase
MSSEPNSHRSTSSLSEKEIDRLCDRFEAQWKTGERPRIKAYLAQATGPIRSPLLREFLKIDLAYRRRRGEQPRYTDYEDLSPLLTPRIFRSVVDEVTRGSSTAAAQASPSRTPTAPLTDSSAPEASTAPEEGDAETATSFPWKFGNYEVLSELGKGAMGIVYLARHQVTTKLVALKLVRMDRLEHLTARHRKEWITRFRSEAQAAGRISDDRVATVYDAGELNGRPYYAMRYVKRTLAEVIKAGPLPNRPAAILMEQVARAVHAVHEEGLLHRDLKPSNILVDAQGRAYVSDFGLAKFIDAEESPTHTGQVLGTPEYMSPEQAVDASHVTKASDVYGLGATFYAVLTGRPPFRGKTVAETLHQVKYRDHVPPRRVNKAVDRDLDSLIFYCLEKQPKERYDTAAAVADELKRYLEGRPIKRRPPGPVGRTWRWCRRKPALATISAAAILLLALTGILSVAVSLTSRERDRVSQELEEIGKAAVPQPGQTIPADQNAVKGDENPPNDQGEVSQNVKQRVIDRLAEANKTKQDKTALDYLQAMRQVYQLIDSAEHASARELLNNWRDTPYCAWEWHFAAARLRDAGFSAGGPEGRALAANRTESFTLSGHRSPVLAVAINPDGTRLASGDSEGIVKVWDLKDKKQQAKKLQASGRVTALTWSHDGKQLAAACQGSPFGGPPALAAAPPGNPFPPNANRPANQAKQRSTKRAGRPARGSGKIFLWDAAGSKQVLVLNQAADIHPPSSMPLPAVRAGASQEELDAARIRQEAAFSRQRLSLSSWPPPLMWSPNGKLVLADQDGKIQMWDLKTLKKDPVSVLTAHEGGVHCAALSPDGNRVASISYDGVVKLWDLAATARNPPFTLNVPPREQFNNDPTYALVWTKEGKCIEVVSRYGEIRELDVDAGKVGEARQLIPRDPNVQWALGGVGSRGERFVWSPDARLLVSVQTPGEMTIWDAVTGKEGLSMAVPDAGPGMAMPGAICAPAWDSSGQRVVMGGSNGAIQAWPVVLRRQAVRTPNIPGAVGWSADNFLLGTFVYSSAEDETMIEQGRMGEEALKIMQESMRRSGGGLSPPDPRLLQLGNRGRPDRNAPLRKPRPSIKIHDSVSGEVVHTLGNTTDRSATTPSMLAASPDGKWVASLTHPGLIQVWSLTAGEQSGPIPVDNLPASPVPEGGSQARAILLAWSPDGKLLAYTSDTDPAIQIWEVETRKKLPCLKREGKPFLRSLAWNPDSNRLAAASLAADREDGMVEVWDVNNHKIVRDFPYFVKYEPHISKVRPNCSTILSWCCDKKRLAVFDDNDEVKIVDVEGDEIILLHGRPTVFDVQNSTRTVAWSPDGKRLAYASQDETIMLYDTNTWQEVLSLRLPKKASLSPFGIGFGGRLAWSPDGWQLGYFTGGGVLIWDANPADEMIRKN